MAKIDESQLGEDFSYIIRIADSDIDGLKQVKQGLTSIKGIGERSAEQICKIAGVDPGMLSGHLGDCLLYTSPSPRDAQLSRMPSSA